MSKNIKILSVFVFAISLFCVEVFAQPSGPVTLQADTIIYDSSTGVSVAEGNVIITQEDGQATGSRAEYNMSTKVGWLSGGVYVTKGDATLSASTVYIRDSNHITAEGSANFSKAGDSISANTLDYWSDRQFAQTSGGWGKITQQDGSTLSASYIEYDMKTGIAVAEQNVEINSTARNLTAAGDKATYTTGTPENPGEIVLTGNAWAIQDGNKIVGNSLIIKSDSSTSEARGNVRMDIKPKEKTEEIKPIENEEISEKEQSEQIEKE